jgi:hypothetical protein
MVLDVLNEFFSDGGGLELGGEVAVQYWHSSNPFAGYYPHVQGVQFDLAWDKRENKVVRLSDLFVSRDVLLGVRRSWRARLETRYGRSSAKDVNVWFHYSSGWGRLRHAVSYDFRSVNWDMAKYVRQAVVPEDADSVWVRKMLSPDRHFRRVSRFGWFQPCVLPKFLKVVGSDLVLPEKALRDRERQKVFCPTCGMLMERVGAPYGFDQVRALGRCLLSYVDEGGGFGG